MKRIYLACALSLFALTAARADSLMTVRIPYPFVFAGVTMPAGVYIIHEMEPSNAMVLRAPDGRSITIMSQPGQPATPGAPAELVFRSVNGRMVLSEVYHDAGEPTTVR